MCNLLNLLCVVLRVLQNNTSSNGWSLYIDTMIISNKILRGHCMRIALLIIKINRIVLKN